MRLGWVPYFWGKRNFLEKEERVSPLVVSQQVPLLIAHRGGTGQHRQSSFAAYRASAAIPWTDFLECDITSSKDGVLFCAHGPDIQTVVHSKSFDHLGSPILETLDPVVDRTENRTSLFSPVSSWYLPDYLWVEDGLNHLTPACPRDVEDCPHLTNFDEFMATLDQIWDIALQTNEERYWQATEGFGESAVPPMKEYHCGSIPAAASYRPLGLYLELKHSLWYQSNRSVDVVANLLTYIERRRVADELRSGEAPPMFPIYLQSFDFTDLIRLKLLLGSEPEGICLVGLIGHEALSLASEEPNGQTNFYSSGIIATSDGDGGRPILELKPLIADDKMDCEAYVSSAVRTSMNPVTGYEYANVVPDLDAINLKCVADAVGYDREIIAKNPMIVPMLKEKLLKVHVWTVADQKDMEDLKGIQVDGIFTDDVEMSHYSASSSPPSELINH